MTPLSFASCAQARASADVYWIMFVCAIIVLAIVDGGLIYAGVKFRDRPGHIAKQFHGHNFLELLWTVVPTIMVISFSVLSFQKLNVMNDTSGAGMTVDVQGQQWTWIFNYPKEDRFKLQDGTYLIDGEISHHDSNGGGGVIGEGDTQWMTAGAGILHDEVPTQTFLRNGGRSHGVQLWVNLPASLKFTPPRYQAITGADPVPHSAGVVSDEHG